MRLDQSLFSSGDRVLVAVSGGPDSLSLLHLLNALREEMQFDALEAAHLDHGLRGDESAAEALWVGAWCAERGIPFHLGKADVAALAHDRKCSKQEAAREVRSEFLEATAVMVRANKIATAHTQDDQIETVLMNILRGTGLDGLRGIPAQRGRFARPLLSVSRAEIECYCAAQGLSPRRDPSNLSPDHYTRNKIRLELLPQLARDYNSAVGDALLRLSDIAARDADYLHTQAAIVLAGVTSEQSENALVLDARQLATQHPAMQRHVLRAALETLRGTRDGLTHSLIETLCAALETPPPAPLGLTTLAPHCTIRITKRRVTFRRASEGKGRPNVE